MYKYFTDLSVWKLASDFAVEIFKLTIQLPKQEDYAITSQIRRSSLSISDNVAEGFGRETANDKKKFYIIARGSALEAKNQLIYGNAVGYFKDEEINELIKKQEQIHFELNKLIKSMRLAEYNTESQSQPQSQP